MAAGRYAAAAAGAAIRTYFIKIAIANSFFRDDTCSKNLNPPYPPFSKGGNLTEFL